MKKILNYIIVGILVTFAYSCEEDLPSGSTNYVTFEESPSGLTVDKDATTTKNINVYTGNTTGSDRTFNVMVDASSTLTASYTVPSTVTIPANSNVGSIAVSVTDDDTLSFVAQTLVLDLQDEASINTGENLVINVTELCPGSLVQFFLTLDTWPDETSWEIYDLSGAPVVIFSGGPYDNPADDFAELAFEFCLLPGEYGVVVYDSYGDGGPSYSVKSGATTLVGETTLVNTTSSASTFTVD